jgi:hypothetical protein
MSIVSFIGGLLSPSFRKRLQFRAMMVHPDAPGLYDDFIGFCAGQNYGGVDSPETVGTMVHWTTSRFSKDVCADLDDLRNLFAVGGWNLPVDEQTAIHPALFDAIALGTRGLPRWTPEPIQTKGQAAAYVDNMMRRR